MAGCARRGCSELRPHGFDVRDRLASGVLDNVTGAHCSTSDSGNLVASLSTDRNVSVVVSLEICRVSAPKPGLDAHRDDGIPTRCRDAPAVVAIFVFGIRRSTTTGIPIAIPRTEN
jgi:hypothetical protein